MDPTEIRRLMAAKAEEARALLERAKGEKRDMTAEEDTQYQALVAEARKLKAEAERIEELEELGGFRPGATRARSSDASANPAQRTKDTPEALFCRYLRTGDPGAAAEMRAYNNTDMNIGTPADGGYAVPTTTVNNIVARRDEMSLVPKLGLVRVPGMGLTVNYPIDGEDDVLFTSVGEASSINQDAPALSQKAFTLVKYGKYLTLSWELLRDEDANLLSFIENWVARGWAATQNKAIVTEVLANGTAGLTLDAAATIGQTEIPELVGKLLPEYQEGAQWLSHPTTWAAIQSIASSSIFSFAPTPSGSPADFTLWGYRMNPTSYMTALGASVKSLVFGNFQFVGYREGTQLTALRDPFTAAGNGQVKLWYWFDFVAGVLQAEAIQYATHPSA